MSNPELGITPDEEVALKKEILEKVKVTVYSNLANKVADALSNIVIGGSPPTEAIEIHYKIVIPKEEIDYALQKIRKLKEMEKSEQSSVSKITIVKVGNLYWATHLPTYHYGVGATPEIALIDLEQTLKEFGVTGW
jgi:hypothetical protein